MCFGPWVIAELRQRAPLESDIIPRDALDALYLILRNEIQMQTARQNEAPDFGCKALVNLSQVNLSRMNLLQVNLSQVNIAGEHRG